MITINLRNQAQLSDKHVRFVKLKMIRLSKRFPGISFIDIHVKKEARMYSYQAKVKIDHDVLILEDKHANAFKLCSLGFQECLETLIYRREPAIAC